MRWYRLKLRTWNAWAKPSSNGMFKVGVGADYSCHSVIFPTVVLGRGRFELSVKV